MNQLHITTSSDDYNKAAELVSKVIEARWEQKQAELAADLAAKAALPSRGKRVPYFEPLFQQTFSADDIARIYCHGSVYPHVVSQLKNRYHAENPSYEPTEQERKWGITKIAPESSYWYHFKRKLPQILDLFLDDIDTNRAVITIDYPEAPPCFQTFQFKVIDGAVHLTCYARSLDLDNGLPVDATIFWFAALDPIAKMMQADIAKSTITVISAGAHKYVQE